MGAFDDDRPPFESELEPDQLRAFVLAVEKRKKRGEVITVQQLIDEKYHEYKLKQIGESSFH